MTSRRAFLGMGAVAAAGVVAGATSAATATSWRDVLDLPAVRSPLAPRGLLNGLALAGSRAVAVGQRGHILTSDDAGRSWQQAEVPVSSDLVAVHFPTADAGWAVGHDGVILHSTDGGRRWKRQRDGRPDAADTPLLDVWFEDARSGIAVGAFGLLLRTRDGGANWEPAHATADNPKNLHYYAVRGVGGDLYLAGEQGLLLRWDALAGRFRALATPYPGTFFGVVGNGRAVLAHGLRGNVVRSTDRGATWTSVPTGVASGLTAATLNGRGQMVLASQAGHLLVSADDGASFAPVRIERPFPAAAVLSVGPAALLVAGPRGIHLQPLS